MRRGLDVIAPPLGSDMDIRRTVAGVGSIFRESVSGDRVYLGSCASVLDGSVFVTAGHCVDNTDCDTLWVNQFGASEPDCFTRVLDVHRIPEADMAVILTYSDLTIRESRIEYDHLGRSRCGVRTHWF